MIYISGSLKELRLKSSSKINVFRDNQDALKLVENLFSTKKLSTLMPVLISSVLKDDNLFDLGHVSTEEIIADVLTKGLLKRKH